MKNKQNKPQQPKVRSHVAIAAHFATGGGAHGGGKRRKARKDRQENRQSLRRGDW